jgi:hypothetical protein
MRMRRHYAPGSTSSRDSQDKSRMKGFTEMQINRNMQ